MACKEPGVVVIFNFKVFDNKPSREKSVKDVEALLGLFYIMNLKVYVSPAVTLRDVDDEIEKLSKQDFTDYASIQMIFMSHGDKDNAMHCKDGEFNFVEKALMVFNNPTLDKKPAFLIVEACKGKLDTSFKYMPEGSSLSKNQKLSGMLTSSFEGFVSYMHENGALFIQTFVDVVKENWRKKSYINVLQDVVNEFNGNREINADETDDEGDQTVVLHEMNNRNSNFTFEDFTRDFRINEKP